MFRALPLTLIAFGLTVSLLSTASADPYADAVVSYTPGSGVGDGNDNPNAALGEPEYNDESGSGTFVSLGDGGAIDLAFTNNLIVDDLGDDLTVVEVGAPEHAAVYVSNDNGSTFVFLGEAIGETSFDLTVAGLSSVNTIRIVDTAMNGTGFPFAGFDLDAVTALHSTVNGEKCTWSAIKRLYSRGQ